MKEQQKRQVLTFSKKRVENPSFKRVDFRVLNKNVDVNKIPSAEVRESKNFLETEKDVKSFTTR
jgi:hypothetical protein